MCLAQGHNAVTLVRLENAAPLSRVKHSTTEPLRSPTFPLYHLARYTFISKLKPNLVSFRIWHATKFESLLQSIDGTLLANLPSFDE